MITVDQIVSKWTVEEREKFKDLIEECRKREGAISESSKKTEENIKNLIFGFNDLMSSIGDLQKKSDLLLNTSYETLLNLSKRENIPSA